MQIEHEGPVRIRVIEMSTQQLVTIFQGRIRISSKLHHLHCDATRTRAVLMSLTQTLRIIYVSFNDSRPLGTKSRHSLLDNI